VEVWVKTDNAGTGNDISGITLPLIITSSNPSANAVLDTTAAATFSGTVVALWDQIQHNAQGPPQTFPLTTLVGAVNFTGGYFAGEYHVATLVFDLDDTTTFCIDTTSFGDSRPELSTSFGVDYHFQWQSPCVAVTLYPALTPPIFFDATGPVNLVICDPTGDSIGVDFNTMDSALYELPTDKVSIYSTVPGEYCLKVERDPNDPSPETTYSVDVRIDGTADQALISDSPVPDTGQKDETSITNDPLQTECLSLAGDANASSDYSLGDVISIVNYVFNKTGCDPKPVCWISFLLCRGDWDASQTINLADVIRAVNYIFNKTGGPWKALPVDPCCL
jgi:hypothetical protein